MKPFYVIAVIDALRGLEYFIGPNQSRDLSQAKGFPTKESAFTYIRSAKLDLVVSSCSVLRIEMVERDE